MARIAFVGNSYWPAAGGRQVYERLLARELAKRHDVTALAQHRTTGPWTPLERTIGQARFEPYEDETVTVQCVCPELGDRMRLLPSVALYMPVRGEARYWVREMVMRHFSRVYRRRLRAILAEFDLVHSFNLDFLGRASIDAARELSLPCVATSLVHPGWWLDDEFSVRLLAKCDFVFATLDHEREFLLEKGLQPERVAAIGVPFNDRATGDGAAFRQQTGLAGEEIVCFVGVKRPHKGYKLLLEAAPAVWSRFPEARFVFLGSRTAESGDIFGKVTDPRILEMDHVTAQVKNDALAACDVFCLPSKSESFGIVFLEAWHFGKAVVAGDTAATRQLIESSGGGVLVPHDAGAVADGIGALLDNRHVRASMGEQGWRYARNYTAAQFAHRVDEVYKTLLSGYPIADASYSKRRNKAAITDRACFGAED
jgi:phosphatidylinositol alpha-1,6-mannosyltransferase